MMLAKISTELAERKKKKTPLAWGGLMILKVGRKFAWIPSLDVYESLFFNIGKPKWTPGMKKGKV